MNFRWIVCFKNDHIYEYRLFIGETSPFICEFHEFICELGLFICEFHEFISETSPYFYILIFFLIEIYDLDLPF